jgi:hypothetical protein
MPLIVWLTVWTLVVAIAALPTWLIALVRGRLPAPLHRFFAAYVRYSLHANAFLYMAGGPFPGFTGHAGSYPVDLEIDGPEPQGRWTTGLRWLLAVPAFLLYAALSSALSVAAFGAWCFALATGRMPRGLQAMLAYSLRYIGQVEAYALLLTGVYPHSGPSEVERRVGPPDPLERPEYPFALALQEAW